MGQSGTFVWVNMEHLTIFSVCLGQYGTFWILKEIVINTQQKSTKIMDYSPCYGFGSILAHFRLSYLHAFLTPNLPQKKILKKLLIMRLNEI